MSAALPKTDVYRTSSQGGLFGFNTKIFAYESGPPVLQPNSARDLTTPHPGLYGAAAQNQIATLAIAMSALTQ
jgi:hypothetical protein